MAEHVTEPNAVAGPEPHFIADERELHDVLMRLHRAEGQLHGVVGMLQGGRSCQDVVTQLAAVSKAVDRAAYQLIAVSLRECLVEGGDPEGATTSALQKLFMTLA